MFQDMKRLATMESEIFECLDLARECGLGTTGGQAAFHMGMERFDRLSDFKAEYIYTPLSEDAATRDYVSHLDANLFGLMGRIDVLRTHVEVALAAGTDDLHNAHASLERLRRQLQIRFRRESALLPVFESWRQRHAGANDNIVEMAAAGH